MLKKEVLIEAQPQFNAAIGEDIGYELGAKMIKDYYDLHNEGGSQFIGKNILTALLNQSDCIGIKIYRGLNEAGKMKYVITGVNSDGKDILEVTAVTPQGELNSEKAIVADRLFGSGWFDNER
jgi:hypothetical protein